MRYYNHFPDSLFHLFSKLNPKINPNPTLGANKTLQRSRSKPNRTSKRAIPNNPHNIPHIPQQQLKMDRPPHLNLHEPPPIQYHNNRPYSPQYLLPLTPYS